MELAQQPSLINDDFIAQLSIEDLEFLHTEADSQLCRQDFAHFMRTFWDIVEPDKELIWAPHLNVLTNHCMKVGRQVGERRKKEYDTLVNIPPGTTKSLTISVFFPLWCWINWPWMRFINCSTTQVLADKHAGYCKAILKSERFRRYFPEITVMKGRDTLRNFRLAIMEGTELKVGGGRASVSVEGEGIGDHADIIIVDDPVDPKKAYSDVERQSVNDWLSQTLSQRRTEKSISHYIMVMQRVHEGDPAGDMLQRMGSMFRMPDGKSGRNPDGKVYHICLPGEIKNYRDKVSPPELVDIYSEDGLLDPVRMDWDVLYEMEAKLGQYGYAGQVGQTPTPPGGGMFKPDRILPLDLPLPEHISINRVVRYWDKAGTDAKDATSRTSWTCGIKMALANLRLPDDSLKRIWIIMDEVRGQWESHERESFITNTMQADGQSVKVGIEQEGGSGGKESATNTIDRNPGYSITADRVSGKGSKDIRADTFSIQVNRGNVYMIRGDFNFGYKEEMRGFPLGITKDRMDASSGAFNMLNQGTDVEIIY